MAQVEAVQQIELEKLTVHESNPRADVGDVSELRASIEAQGILEPLIAVRENGGYAVVAGSRRLAAAKVAGLRAVPVIVREMTDEQATAAALIENLQREDLNPLEEARGYKAWLDLTKKTQAELAKAVGKAPSTIANALRVLDAAPPIQKALEKGDITLAHAKIAMSLPETALPMVELKAGTSVKELEEQAKDAQRSHIAIERLRAAKEKAEKDGKVVTWPEREIYLGGVRVDLRRVFGEPAKKAIGTFTTGYGVSRAIHDKVCECNAVAIAYGGQLEGACVSPAGWKKAEAAARTSVGRSSPTQKKKAKTAEQKAKEVERDRVAAEKEAAAAIDFKKLDKYHPLKLAIAPKYIAGGLAGEPARLALFGYVHQYGSGDRKSKTFEVELWKTIATLPLAKVREHLTKWAVAFAFGEIDDSNRYKPYGSKATGLGQDNAKVIRRLVDAHYAPRKAKKAAKR